MPPDTNLLKNLNDNEISLELSAIPTSEIDSRFDEIKRSFVSLSDSHARHLYIHADAMTEAQAKLILSYLKEHELSLFSMKMTLPEHLRQSRVQVEIDNEISNHHLHKNNQQLTGILLPNDPSKSQSVTGNPKEHQRPKKVRPKIEVTLYEESYDKSITEHLPEEIVSSPIKTKTNIPMEPAKLERSPMAACIVNELLTQPGFEEQKALWEQLTNPQEALEFRKTFLESKVFTIENHPIKYLLRNDPTLLDKLHQWTSMLKLEMTQYDALLDVVGQYGTVGLERLFELWEGNRADPFKSEAFLQTHALLLKYMPSYLPFIQDCDLNEIVSKIANLSVEKRSWWFSLIKNHTVVTRGYTDLPYLFKVFTQASVVIEEMGLPFYCTESVKAVNTLPLTLSKMINLLQKCPRQDREVQWRCINQVEQLDTGDEHFILPEMKLGEDHPDVEDMREMITHAPESDPNGIIPAFYRYIAKKKQHLPLTVYEKTLTEILSRAELSNQNKLRMIYVLAKTTATDNEIGFDAEDVYKEWSIFENRTIKLEYMERIKANRNAIARMILSKGIEAEGGDFEVRNKVLQQIMNMPLIPPMNYLNKFFTLSEYKFLNPKLSLLDMKGVQKKLGIQLELAATFYSRYPDVMIKAARLVKTDAVMKNQEGKYIPEEKDITLLERFVVASSLLCDPKSNTLIKDEINPRQILLPLLTTFHLEDETEEALAQMVERYKARISATNHPEYQDVLQNMLPYGLSLLQLINNREKPAQLDLKVLDKIQDELVALICTPTLVCKKHIRKWMHEKYGAYFSGNELLDIKDEVNFGSLFESLACNEKDTRLAIETLVSHFDEDEDKGYHGELVTDLVELTKQLTPLQSKQFFEYCHDALKTGGILSRTKQATPPSYIQQFRTLVQTVTSKKSIAEFTQYLIIAREYTQNGGTDMNHLMKCDALINAIYPSLLEKCPNKKEAFNFTAHLVCQTPVEGLSKSHECVSFAPDLMNFSSPEMNQLEEKIRGFYSEEMTLEGLLNIQEKIHAILALSPNDMSRFTPCREIIKLIDQINARIESQKAEHTQKPFLKRAWHVVTHFSQFKPTLIEEDLSALSDAGLEQLAQAIQPDLQDLHKKNNTRFQDVVLALYDKKQIFVHEYSNIVNRANDFMTKALTLSPEDIGKNYNEISRLIDELILLKDQNLVLSLMYHFAGGMPGRGVSDLVELLNRPDYQSLDHHIKKDFINVIMSQMNNSVKCSKDDVLAFLTYLSNNKDKQVITDCLHDFYQHAPYPPLEKFMLWTKNLGHREALDKAYQQFDKNPCALTSGNQGREEANGFKLEAAMEIKSKMPDAKEIFTNEYLSEVQRQSEDAKTMSTASILQMLKDYQNRTYPNHILLVTLAAELLHRCKGRPPEFVGDIQIPGRSYELNTTQIMAILAMLETGKKVTAEIATGEGKTRILMIINACQFLKGNTVDFLTSNLALAERDYLDSLPFFKSLGAEVNFITASSKIEDYKIGGINVSDPANLFLFRKKGGMQSQSNQVIDPKKAKRALTLDEADVTFYDVSNTKYNFASNTPKMNMELLPLYPLLMEFFAQKETEDTYFGNKKRCGEQLLDFIEARNPELFNIVKIVSENQIESWLNAAYVARHLEYNIDYSVVSEAIISTDLGHQKVAAAMCLIGGRVNENARFSEGVHACLHAELNRLMKSSNMEEISPYLREMLQKCKQKERQLQIEPQRQIASTTSTSTMLKDYDKGSLMAVTGSAGTDIEKREAKAYFNTDFIQVPRHKGLHRYDRPIVVCTNDKNYIDTFVTSILEARAKNEPTLIICKDDNQSRTLYEALQRRLESKKDKNGCPKINRIHAGTDYEDGFSEASFIKNEAGKPGQVTISTEMVGRGVDIIPGPQGLRVLHAYLPREERDYIQGVGRSGRFGVIGTTQMILNMESLKQDFGIDYLNTDFYLNPEAYIRRLQIFSTITKKLHRLFSKGFDDLLGAYTEKYEQFPMKDRDSIQAWSQFLAQMTHSQESTQLAIEAQIQQACPNVNEIEGKLAEHYKNSTELWHTFLETLPEAHRTRFGNAPPVSSLRRPKELDGWLETMKKLQASNTYQVEVTEKRTVKIHEQASAVMAGRTNILKYPGTFTSNIVGWFQGKGKLFPNLQAPITEKSYVKTAFSFINDFRAWWRGEGLLFPNLRAWLSGNLSFRNMISQWPIFCYFITPVEETHDVKITIPSTYAFFYNQYPELTTMDNEVSPMTDEQESEQDQEDFSSEQQDSGFEEDEPSSIDSDESVYLTPSNSTSTLN